MKVEKKIALLKERLNKKSLLPGWSSQKKMAVIPINNITAKAFIPPADAKQASVAVILFEKEGSLTFLLTKRTSNVEHHKGQISLPGGAIDLGESVNKEFNIEGNPIDKFIDLVMLIKPTQVTLVPDDINAITSNAGWNTKKHWNYLKSVIDEFKKAQIRTSIFVDPDLEMVEYAKKTGTDRIELYTEEFAKKYELGELSSIDAYAACSSLANELEIGVNAGHDLSLQNIEFFAKNMPYLEEVSIGHALISESIYLGIDNVINLYIDKLNR